MTTWDKLKMIKVGHRRRFDRFMAEKVADDRIRYHELDAFGNWIECPLAFDDGTLHDTHGGLFS